MSYFFPALQAEWLKVRKSKVIRITAVVFTIAPLMAGFFMIVLINPEFANSSGLLRAKAQFAGEADWASYLRLHAQIIAVGGILVFGFVTSWIFGREYADRTAKDLLALPYSRGVIVIAKFIVSFITNILLSAYVLTLGIIIGWIIGLPQWSSAIFVHGLSILLVVTFITISLSTPVAFIASYGGGYLAPLGFVILTVVLSQIVAVTGFGDYFPWAIPAIFSGLTEGDGVLSFNSLFIIIITSLLGIFSTLYWWIFADQH